MWKCRLEITLTARTAALSLTGPALCWLYGFAPWNNVQGQGGLKQQTLLPYGFRGLELKPWFGLAVLPLRSLGENLSLVSPVSDFCWQFLAFLGYTPPATWLSSPCVTSSHLPCVSVFLWVSIPLCMHTSPLFHEDTQSYRTPPPLHILAYLY